MREQVKSHHKQQKNRESQYMLTLPVLFLCFSTAFFFSERFFCAYFFTNPLTVKAFRMISPCASSPLPSHV